MGLESSPAVLDFWFGVTATDPETLGLQMRRWFMGGPTVDAEIISRFGPVTEAAVNGELSGWASTTGGRLALTLVLDQFTRSVFRDQPRMYLGDPLAQRLVIDALAVDGLEGWDTARRNFQLMPLAHAEDLALQNRGVVELEKLVAAAPQALRPMFSMGIEQTRKYRDVIARFGRFPHRNAILGRTSTPEEVEFLRDWASKMRPSGAAKLA